MRLETVGFSLSRACHGMPSFCIVSDLIQSPSLLVIIFKKIKDLFQFVSILKNGKVLASFMRLCREQVKSPDTTRSLSVLIESPGLLVCQVFFPVLLAASHEAISYSRTISTGLPSVFFDLLN